jgi:hypothetical protein
MNPFRTGGLDTGSKVVGHAKVVSYEDILEAQRKRDAKAVASPYSNRQQSHPIISPNTRDIGETGGEREG